jgi:hypothetical protein
MDQSNASHAVMGLLSGGGPEVPPDVVAGPVRPAVDTPTQPLPVITRPPKVEARAVIVYEPQPRRRWGLWLFTALLVALTAGVVLGQAVAYQPPARAVATTPPWPAANAVPSPPAYSGPPTPPAPATAPLGAARAGRIEVTGAAESVRIRTVDLGDLLFSVSATGLVTPIVRDSSAGPRVEVAAAGPGPVEILVHSAVRWTVRLGGTATRHDVDLSGGRVAGLELAGGSAYAAVLLPRPAGRIRLRVTGAVADLRIDTAGAPARLRLSQGASAADFGGRTRNDAGPGTTLRSTGWTAAKSRYDIDVSSRPGTVAVRD